MQFAISADPAIELVRCSMRDQNSMNSRSKITLNNHYVIAPSVALNEALLFSAALDQHFHFASDPFPIPFERDLLLQMGESPKPLDLYLTGDVLEVNSRRRSFPL